MIRNSAMMLAAVIFLPNIAFAQDAKLVDAAKKESWAIIAYGSMESNTAEPIIDAFMKTTGLRVEYWRASATKAMDRAGEFVTRKGIYPPVPGADKIQGVEMGDFDAKEFRTRARSFRRSF